jgi:hypothetical protein
LCANGLDCETAELGLMEDARDTGKDDEGLKLIGDGANNDCKSVSIVS